MDFEELKQKDNVKVLLRGKSGRGKTRLCCKLSLEVSRAGGEVLYVDTEAEGSSTMVAMIEHSDSKYEPSDVDNIEYVQANDYSELIDYVDNEGRHQANNDLVVIDTLDHKHSYVLKAVTDAKHDGDADWQEYASIYAEEKEVMEMVGKPPTNVIATLDPESGSRGKPKGAQTNIRGYFTIVLRMLKSDDDWTHKIINWVGHSDRIGKKVPSPKEILNIIINKGDNHYDLLKGNYYIILFNKNEGRITIYASPMHIYPSFFTLENSTFIFSNLLEYTLKSRKTNRINKIGLIEFSLFDHPIGMGTLYENVYSPIGGQKIIVKNNTMFSNKYIFTYAAVMVTIEVVSLLEKRNSLSAW